MKPGPLESVLKKTVFYSILNFVTIFYIKEIRIFFNLKLIFNYCFQAEIQGKKSKQIEKNQVFLFLTSYEKIYQKLKTLKFNHIPVLYLPANFRKIYKKAPLIISRSLDVEKILGLNSSSGKITFLLDKFVFRPEVFSGLKKLSFQFLFLNFGKKKQNLDLFLLKRPFWVLKGSFFESINKLFTKKRIAWIKIRTLIPGNIFFFEKLKGGTPKKILLISPSLSQAKKTKIHLDLINIETGVIYPGLPKKKILSRLKEFNSGIRKILIVCETQAFLGKILKRIDTREISFFFFIGNRGQTEKRILV